MLMMRLQRVGRRNDPSYRVVVTDKRTGPKSNKHVAILGSYNPKMDHIQLDTDAAKDWLAKGVQPSDTVHHLLVSQKVLDGKKVNVLPKKSPIVSESTEEETAAPEASEEAAAETAATESETTEETPAEEEKAEEEPKAEESTPEAEESAEESKEEAKSE